MADDTPIFDPQLAHFADQEQPDVSWEYLFQPSEWYVTPSVIAENYLALAAAVGAILVAAAVFLYARNQGIKSDWYRKLKRGRFNLSDSTTLQAWLVLYIPLALSSWLVWVYGGKEWNRALTVYSLHLLVNVLFAVSLWWVRDLSLALLNLITLIGVAMFTSTQFNSVLKFASFINTPYLLFLFFYTIQFAYFWYLNEGKELMDIAQMMKKGGSLSTATSGKKGKKKSVLPKNIKQKLQQRVQAQREASANTPVEDNEDKEE
jgi:benzodiazapine receptor